MNDSVKGLLHFKNGYTEIIRSCTIAGEGFLMFSTGEDFYLYDGIRHYFFRFMEGEAFELVMCGDFIDYVTSRTYNPRITMVYNIDYMELTEEYNNYLKKKMEDMYHESK